jgi:NADP-dependent 3-hydroxy acid dehydrogenase YdfG/acyl carrier protein
VYERLATAGYHYGPAFRGLVAAWSAGSDRFVEVRLPSAVPANGYGVHPALLDAVLHLLVLEGAEAGAGMLLPFSFSGVRITGTTPETLRARLSRSVDGEVAVAISDGEGRPIGGVAALILRPGQPAVAAGSGLQQLDWVRTPIRPSDRAGMQWAVLGADPLAERIAAAVRADGIAARLCPDLTAVAELASPPGVVLLPYQPDAAEDDLAATVYEGLAALLEAVQEWVAQDRGGRLVVLADPDEITSAPAWGLLRSAAAEHPGRFALAHSNGDGPGTWRLLAAALDADEPQCVVRDGAVLVPRVADATAGGTTPDLTGGTVLITGGTRGLGALVAAQLVDRHGVRDLLLTSRRGTATAGVAEVVADLERRGAKVRVAACDVADRRALAALLASVPADRPLAGVVHAAGVLDDGAVDGMSRDQLDAVLRPKVDAGWLLHELTADLPLSMFVLFSSVAGVVGTLGQAGYAAANVFLDALAQHRTRLGLPGVSIGWGLWSLPTGMTSALSAADRARLAGAGLADLPLDQGLALFDAALAATGLVLASDWDLAAVQARAAVGGEIPPVLRSRISRKNPVAPTSPGVSTAPTRGSAAATGVAAPTGGGLADRLTGVDRAAALTVVRDLVRAQVATALGHVTADAVDVDAPFIELGLDSLTAVELRNRLGSATGLQLPATLVFNRPSVVELSDYLLAELVPAPPTPDEVLQRALDQVAAQLDGADGRPEQRDQVLALLEAAVARLAGTRQDDQMGDIDEVSDDEMFAFIDNQL